MSDSSSDWPLLPPSSQPSSSRLADVEARQPKLPKLPAHENWVYSASSLAQLRKKKEELKLAAQLAGSKLDSNHLLNERIQDENDHAEGAGNGDADSHMYDDGSDGDNDDRNEMDAEESKSDNESDRAESTSTQAKSINQTPKSSSSTFSSSSSSSSRPSHSPDPLYGAELDAADEAWVSRLINRGRPNGSRNSNRPSSKSGSIPSTTGGRDAPRTDAFLSCPACFTPLCLDCQRHATRPTMFRAMFVLDGIIVDKGRLVKPIDPTPEEAQMKYYATLCRVCKTHVGVFDEDEIYHFFHVIESQG